MKPNPPKPDSPLRLDLLAKLEQLIEGLGQALLMMAGSVVIAPLQYLRSSPPAFVRRAVRRRRILPPLLFLLIGCFALTEFVQVMAEAAAATNVEEALQKHWHEIRRLDPWTFVGRAGGVFFLLWLTCELAAAVLSRVLARPREPLRHATLYLGGFAVLSLGIGTIIVSVAMFGGDGTIYETAVFRRSARWLAIAIFALPVVPAAGLGVYAARRLRRLGRLPGGRAALAGAAAMLPVLLALLFGLAGIALIESSRLGQALSLTAWLDNGNERLRTILIVEARRCTGTADGLRCTVLLRSRGEGPVLIDEVLIVELHRRAKHGLEPARFPLPVAALSWRPPVGEGDVLRLTVAEPTAASLTLASTAICEATAALTDEAVAASDWSLRLQLSGYGTGGGRTFETYLMSVDDLDGGRLVGIRRRC